MEFERKPINYRGIEVLAPMVRACTLPLRMEALKYGADLVYSEELIDKKVAASIRRENPDFGTVEFLLPEGKALIFSTCKEEREKVVLQLGTANSGIALKAALNVLNDVAAIDVNMGCPKSFSVKGGMGAALLKTPEVAEDIIKTLRRNLPADVPVTCKIRLLGLDDEGIQETIKFMKIMENAGAAAIGVHARIQSERPAHPAHWDVFKTLKGCVDVPIIANGDFFTRNSINKFFEFTSADSIMIARGALRNPAVFMKEAPPSKEQVVADYMKTAVKYGATYQNTKWCLSQFVQEDAFFNEYPVKDFQQILARSKTMKDLSVSCGYMDYETKEWPENAHSVNYYRKLPIFDELEKLSKASAEPSENVEPESVEANVSLEGNRESVPDKRGREEELAGDSKRLRVEES